VAGSGNTCSLCVRSSLSQAGRLLLQHPVGEGSNNLQSEWLPKGHQGQALGQGMMHSSAAGSAKPAKLRNLGTLGPECVTGRPSVGVGPSSVHRMPTQCCSMGCNCQHARKTGRCTNTAASCWHSHVVPRGCVRELSHAVHRWSRPHDSADVQRPACMHVSAACHRLGHSARQQANTRGLTEISHCKAQCVCCAVLCHALQKHMLVCGAAILS
jgi:hypothetical protein